MLINLQDAIENNRGLIEEIKSESNGNDGIREEEKQRRREWLLQRRGYFTASDAWKLMTEPRSKSETLSETAKTYIKQKAVEQLTEMDDSEAFVSYDMQWGIDHELEAIAYFERWSGKKVSNTGDGQKFFLHPNGVVGATPDGVVYYNDELVYGVEVKCPGSIAHFEHCQVSDDESLKAIAPKYYWQIQCSMWVTGANYWYFISYDPRYKIEKDRLHAVRIDRDDEDIARLAAKLTVANEHKEMLLERFRDGRRWG